MQIKPIKLYPRKTQNLFMKYENKRRIVATV